MSRTDGRLVVLTFAIAFSWALAAAILYVFTVAYANGGMATVRINAFGEAEFELALLVGVVMPTVAVGLALFLEVLEQ